MLHPNTVTISHLTAWIVLLSATWHEHNWFLKQAMKRGPVWPAWDSRELRDLGLRFFFWAISTLLFGLSFCLSLHTVLMISHDGKWQHSSTATVLCASGQLLCKGGPKDKGSGAAVQLRNSAWAASWMRAGFLGCEIRGISTGFVLRCFSMSGKW